MSPGGHYGASSVVLHPRNGDRVVVWSAASGPKISLDQVTTRRSSDECAVAAARAYVDSEYSYTDHFTIQFRAEAIEVISVAELEGDRHNQKDWALGQIKQDDFLEKVLQKFIPNHAQKRGPSILQRRKAPEPDVLYHFDHTETTHSVLLHGPTDVAMNLGMGVLGTPLGS